MKISDCINMSLVDLKKRKLRTFLTSFGIAIGTMLIIVMFGLGEGIQKESMKKFQERDTFKLMDVLPIDANKGDEEQNKEKKIDRNAVEEIRKLNGVKGVTASVDSNITGFKMDGKSGKKVKAKGVDLEYDVFSSAEKSAVKNTRTRSKANKNSDEPIIAGNVLQKGNQDEVLVGQKCLEKIGITDFNGIIGKEIELDVEFPAMEGMPKMEPLKIKGKVAGVVNANYKDGSSIMVPVDMASRIQQYYTGENEWLSKKGYSQVQVECNSFQEVKPLGENVKKLGYAVNSSAEYAEMMKTQSSVMKAIFTAAGAIVLMVSAIGVINTMTMSVAEKTKSIGIMKAQGASKRNISTMFTVQSGVLGFIGGVIGTVLALAASVGINQFVATKMKAKGIEDISNLICAPIWMMVATIGFAVLISMIAGFIPSRRAAKLDPVESLRYE